MIENSKACFEYETYHEGENKILKISCENCNFPPSVEYSDLCMSKVVDTLMAVTGATIIILSQQREYQYDYDQVSLLNELASVYKHLTQEERFSYSHLVVDPLHERYIRSSYSQFQRFISKRLKEDPFAAFVELKRLETREKIKLNSLIDARHNASQRKFISILESVIKIIENMKVIKLLMPHSHDYKVGEREIYNNIFHPTTKPDFMFTKLLTDFPQGNLEDSYNFKVGEDDCEVNIFSFDDNVKILYHLTPPEFIFSEEEYQLLDDAKRIMSEHKPAKEEFVDPQRMREVFFNIGKDLLTDLAQHQNLRIKDEKMSQLAQALLRHTVGFGLIELLLSDSKVQRSEEHT